MNMRGILAGLILCTLTACGGGGGSSEPTVSLRTPVVTMDGIERNPTTGELAIAISNVQPGTSVYFGVEGGRTLLADVLATTFSDVEHLALTLRTDLEPGPHEATVRVHVCLDAACAQELHGSPMTATLRSTISPNIAVAALTTLARTGADAAPSATIPVTIPAVAGVVALAQVNVMDGLGLDYVDGAIQVSTGQLRAGVYTATGRLQARDDPRYFADFAVQYTVNPPPGGEHALSVDTPSIVFSLSQGATRTRQIVVTRPTWTNDFQPLSLAPGCDPMYTLRDLGGDIWELKADAVGLPVSIDHHCGLIASAGGSTANVEVQSYVGLAFDVGSPQAFAIGAATTSAQLSQALPVHMTDDSAIAWTASTSSPWLRIAHTTGTTGVDALALSVDTSHLADYLPGDTAHVIVNVARAAVPAQDIPVSLAFPGPYVQRSWIGGSTTWGGHSYTHLYLDGAFASGVTTNGTLTVAGAHVLAAREVYDNAFLSVSPIVQLTVDNYTPGQPITVTATSPYLTTQAAFAAPPATPTYPAGFAALPYGLRKPPSFSPVNGALYFGGQDTVWRYATAGGAWTLSSAAAPGIVDVDPRADERHLLEVTAHAVALLDPTSLSTVWSGVPIVNDFGATTAIVGAQDADSKSVLHTSDGYTWVTYETTSSLGVVSSAGVGRIVLGFADGIAPANVQVDEQRGVHSVQASDGTPARPWMIGSAGRQTVLATSRFATDALALLGESRTRLDVGALIIAPSNAMSYPVPPAGVANAGSTLVRTDGVSQSYHFGFSTAWDLSAGIPAGQTVGGWTVTGDAQYALLYTYQLTGSGDTATASAPTLHVFDISPVTIGGLVPTEVATLPMAGVPGCGSPRAAGETCQHAANLLVDPTGSVAFVVGPRGVVAVPLPGALTTFYPQKVGDRRKAAAARSLTPAPAVRR